MFDHPLIEVIPFSEIPLNQDLFLMEEKWMEAYEQDLIKIFNGEKYDPSGYVSYVAARAITAEAVELSWYPNIHDRFHEVKVTLPKNQFVTCVEVWQYDEKPRIFARNEWIKNLHLRSNSVFALVDVIGIKDRIQRGDLSRSQLVALRGVLDNIASRHSSVAFVSFADSLLLKTNWSVGTWDSEVSYSYDPEYIIRLIPEIQTAYRDVLGMEVYVVISQGINEFYNDDLLHINGNHISLNSLGLPFAQIIAIDGAVRRAIRQKIHEPQDVYMDRKFFYSLRFKYGLGINKSERPKYPYRSPLTRTTDYYHLETIQFLVKNIQHLSDNK